MRMSLIALALAGCMAIPTFVMGGHGGGGGNNNKLATLTIENHADAAVEVSVNGDSPFILQPLETRGRSFAPAKGNKADVTVSATVSGLPTISATESATIQAGKATIATITSPTSSTLAITFSGSGLFAAKISRESGVVLASSGGLLPLLWLSFLFGRAPRRRDPLINEVQNVG